MRGRAIDAQTRDSLLTPEQRAELQRQQEESWRQQQERDRQYAEAVARRRAELDAQFNDAYMTYRARDRYNLTWVNSTDVINYDTFFDVPVTRRTPVPTLSLAERFNAAVQEADRCAQRGDTLGRVAATRMANELRRQILQQTISTI